MKIEEAKVYTMFELKVIQLLEKILEKLSEIDED